MAVSSLIATDCNAGANSLGNGRPGVVRSAENCRWKRPPTTSNSRYEWPAAPIKILFSAVAWKIEPPNPKHRPQKIECSGNLSVNFVTDDDALVRSFKECSP